MNIFRTPRLAVIAAITLIPMTAVAADAAPIDTAAAQQPPEDAAVDTTHCLTQTGSHLQRDAKHPCVNAPGQVITREQIENSGAVTTAEALRRLSPAVR
jgi:outer membrane cobalamin receptor